MSGNKFKIVLFQPEIPGNTGSIGRTCVALGLELILIRPYGFDINEKSVRRAGLDYWKYLKLTEYDSWDDFIESERPKTSKLFFLSTKTDELYYDSDYSEGCYLIFGKETAGLPESIHEEYPTRFRTMPMCSDKIRSLNLSNVATAVAYEALRVIEFKN